MKTERFPAGKQIFAEGDEGHEAYRILSGSVEVSIQDSSHKVVLAQLGTGEIFGEMAMIEQRPRSATVRVLEELEVEVITREDFSETLQGGGERLVPYLTTIFERLRVTNERLRTALKDLEDKGSPKVHWQTEANLNEDGPRVVILPDSEETASPSALEGRTIKHFPFIIGRRGEVAGLGLFAENRLLVSDRSPYRVSRNHCRIERDSGSFYVYDDRSRLGTVVNDVLIGGPHPEQRMVLNPGENTLILGRADSQIRFKIIV